MRQLIRIGSRRSRLSLWQANYIAELTTAIHPQVRIEIHEYNTRGDLNPSALLPAIGGKGLFTEALEAALRLGEIDCAVHSLKDLPVEDAEGLAIAAIPQRADHRDVLVSRNGARLAELPAGARIGTGSLRRRAQVLALRPDLKIVPIRGNVPTRIKKMHASPEQFDAIVLAAAGLQRLSLDEHISETFDNASVLCAAGQGAIALQCRNEGDALAFFARLTDRCTAQATEAERAFLGALEGGCSVPVAAFAHTMGNLLQLQGRVIAVDGKQQIDVTGETRAVDGPEGEYIARQLGARLAEQALEKGAGRILQSISSGASLADSG